MKKGGWVVLGIVGLALVYLNRQTVSSFYERNGEEDGDIQYPNAGVSDTPLPFLDIMPMLDNPIPTDINVGTSYV